MRFQKQSKPSPYDKSVFISIRKYESYNTQIIYSWRRLQAIVLCCLQMMLWHLLQVNCCWYCCCPTSSGNCEHGIRPWSFRSSSGPGSKVVERQRVAKEQTAQRFRCWTVQNKMKNVLKRIVAGAEWRILHSYDSREVRVWQRAVSVAA